MTSFNFNFLQKILSPNTVSHVRVRSSTYELGQQGGRRHVLVPSIRHALPWVHCVTASTGRSNQGRSSTGAAAPLSDCWSTGAKSPGCPGRSYSAQVREALTIFIGGSVTVQEPGPLTFQRLSLQEGEAQSLPIPHSQSGLKGPILLPLLGSQMSVFQLLETHLSTHRRTVPPPRAVVSRLTQSRAFSRAPRHSGRQ